MFEVTGTTSVSLLRTGFGAERLAVDEDQNLFILSYTYQNETFYPKIFRYDGSSLVGLEGVYTDKSFGGGIVAAGNNLYFLYGERASEIGEGYSLAPTTIRASKLQP